MLLRVSCFGVEAVDTRSNRELTGCANTPQSVYGGGVTLSTMDVTVDS